MVLDDVEKHYVLGRRENRAFLVVCQDVWDFRRGVKDMGYYYQLFDSAEELARRIKDMPFAPEFGERSEDRCHAVIDLKNGPNEFSEPLCHHPTDWLRIQIKAV